MVRYTQRWWNHDREAMLWPMSVSTIPGHTLLMTMRALDGEEILLVDPETRVIKSVEIE